ncbi:MAG: CRISPR-associated protein [Bacteroidales bacterium]|nr:CRISPR-associated protein [Bacteroidales bacterium]
MLINLSNHPFESWSEEQKHAAIKQFGIVEDITFPEVDPFGDEAYIDQLTNQYLDKILHLKPQAVHIMGEMTFCFCLIQKLKENNITCIASTTQRIIETIDGKVIRSFQFAQFRKYL